MTVRSIFVCESQPVVLAGLRVALADAPDLNLVGSSASAADAPNILSQLRPDVVMLGHSHSVRTLMADLPRVFAASPQSHVVLWVVEMAEVECLRALQLGARAVVRKTSPLSSLVACLQAAAAGQIWLEEPHLDRVRDQNHRILPRMTPRERQIVDLVCRGLKNKEIAAELAITPGTVKVHLMHIFEKTGVKDRFQLALHGRQLVGTVPAADGDRSAVADILMSSGATQS